jgi:WS/DGAT/MGAT family acyltransferase
MNGPTGPHRRWVWTESTWADVKRVRAALGGSMNDIVLTAITSGFRDLLASRGELGPRTVVRTMVPVSLRRESERGTLNNQVSAVFVDLPVGEPSPRVRLADVRGQMDAHKQMLGAYDPRVTNGALDLVAPPLLALGVRLLMRSPQVWAQAVTTNVPGPRVPLYLLGRRMTALYPYVPIGAGLRTSVGIFSYVDTITFGINVDFDAVPDVGVLAKGVADGMADLVALAGQEPTAKPRRPKRAAARPTRTARTLNSVPTHAVGSSRRA